MNEIALLCAMIAVACVLIAGAELIIHSTRSPNVKVLTNWGIYTLAFFVLSGGTGTPVPLRAYIAMQCASAISGLTGVYQKRRRDESEKKEKSVAQGS